MGLADKVAAVLATIDYQARECIDSRRRQLHHGGIAYCLLSSPEGYVYCPLQEADGSSYRFRCLRQEYLRELASKNKVE